MATQKYVYSTPSNDNYLLHRMVMIVDVISPLFCRFRRVSFCLRPVLLIVIVCLARRHTPHYHIRQSSRQDDL